MAASGSVPEIDELVIDDRDRGLFRVKRTTMTSEDIWRLERDRIFDHCWLYIATTPRSTSLAIRPGARRQRRLDHDLRMSVMLTIVNR